MVRVPGIFAIAICVMGLSIAGCNHEGPAEKTGKAADHAAERAGEKMEQMGEDVQDKAQGK